MTEAPGVEAYAQRYLAEAREALAEPYVLEAVRRIAPILLAARAAGRTVFLFGNGGSASTASHFVTDLSKVASRGPGRRIKCIGLSDNIPSMTAWANDADYSRIFAEPLRVLGERGDVAIAISGSGNSPNVLEAVRAARELGITTVGLTGIGGGKLKGLVDVAVVVPSNSMQHTEDVHVTLLHLLTAYLRDEGPVSER
ncbi:MAG TPA: SIS domain-containing protein [Thermoplasmata archaeon]|nr:SIS domain-containing protein [Thermoplasmata archaeon]